MATTKKKSKPKTKPVEEYVDPFSKEGIEEEVVSQFDLSKSQKIILTKENFTLLKNFVTGKFPETFGEPYERIKIMPEKCPHCRFTGGWDYAGGATVGAMHAGFGKEYFRQNRVVSVNCLACGGVYKVTESWLIYFQVTDPVAAEQT